MSPAGGDPDGGLATPKPEAEAGRFGRLRYIGQLGDTYLLCRGDEGLVVIDDPRSIVSCSVAARFVDG